MAWGGWGRRGHPTLSALTTPTAYNLLRPHPLQVKKTTNVPKPPPPSPPQRPHRPHRPHATPPPSALRLHCPIHRPNPLRPTAVSALPTHSTSSPPSLTHRPHRPSSPPPRHLLTTLAAQATARRLGPNGMNSKLLLGSPAPATCRNHNSTVYRRRVRKCGSRSLPRLSSMVKKLGTTSLGTMAEVGSDTASLDSHLSAFGVGGTGGSP